MFLETSVPLVGPKPQPGRSTVSSYRYTPFPWPRLLAALATGGLLWLCYFPVAWGWLAWSALVPLLTLVRSAAPESSGYLCEERTDIVGWLARLFTGPRRRVFFCAWAGGLCFFVPIIQWMRVADPRMVYTWLALGVYCSLYFPVAVLLLRFLDRRTPLPLVVTLPVVWTALEFFRAVFATGFAWYLLGHTQHAFLPAIQVSDLAGAYAVTFVVVAVNALLFELLASRHWFRALLLLVEPARPRRLAWQTAGVALLVGGTLAYGFWRLGQADFEMGPRVALIQGNLPQQIRNDADARQDALLDHYTRLTSRATHGQPQPALLIWPETSYPDDWEELIPQRGPLNEDQYQAWVTNLRSKLNRDLLHKMSRWNVPVLLGLNTRVAQEVGPRQWRRERYNSAILVQPDNRALLDGVAVRGDDLPRDRAILTLLPHDPTGQTVVGPQEAMPIHKGERLPPGADAVVWERYARILNDKEVLIDEKAVVDGDREQPVRPGMNVVRMTGRYDKMHLVMFGEYVPFRETLPFMNSFAPYDYDYSVEPGQHLTRFPLKVAGRTYHFGVIICFEDSDSDLARQYNRTGADGPPADFLINISNDGWFDGTSEHEQHLAVCRFRAVESRRSIVRSVNMGISAVIDGNGRVLAPETITDADGVKEWVVHPGAGELPLSRWGEFKKVKGVLTAAVPLDGRTSLYAAWGDWLAWGCWAALAGCVAWAILRRQRPAPSLLG